MRQGMTVRELAQKLLQLPSEVQDWPVTTEGCDCDGDAGSIDVDDGMQTVYIKRALENDTTPSYSYQPSEIEKELRAKGLLPE